MDAAELAKKIYGLGPLDDPGHVVQRIDFERTNEPIGRVLVTLHNGTVLGKLVKGLDRQMIDRFYGQVGRLILPETLAWLKSP